MCAEPEHKAARLNWCKEHTTEVAKEVHRNWVHVDAKAYHGQQGMGTLPRMAWSSRGTPALIKTKVCKPQVTLGSGSTRAGVSDAHVNICFRHRREGVGCLRVLPSTHPHWYCCSSMACGRHLLAPPLYEHAQTHGIVLPHVFYLLGPEPYTTTLEFARSFLLLRPSL